MKSHSIDVLVEAIMDGVPIDIQEGTLPLEYSGRVLTNLNRIQSISNLGQESQGTGALEQPQFIWGHLKVFEKIGAGGYGEVYRAFDSVLQREVALKLCRTEKAIAIGKRPYLDEARRLARVRHPGVLPVYGADEFNGRVGLWCELIRGTSLAEKLQKTGPFPYQDTHQIARQVCQALMAVHQSHMVHGDIKLTNLMSDEHKIWLMDFGAVTDLASTGGGTRSLIGTPMYMAPEVLAGDVPTYKSDIYALGVSLIRLSSGNFPFASEDFDGLLIEKRQKVNLSLPNGYPKGWLPIIRKCIHPDPAQRYSVQELLQALKHLEDQPRRKKKRVVMTSALMALSLIAMGFAGLSFQWKYQFKRADREAQNASKLAQMLTQMFDSARPTAKPGEEISAKELVEQAIEHTQNDQLDPEIRMRLDATLGRVIRQLGNNTLSRDHLIQGINSGSKKLPENHPWLLKAKVELVYTYQILSEFNRSIQIGQEVMPHAERLNASDVVAFYTYLADSYQGIEKFEDALKYLQMALEKVKEEPSNVSPFDASNAQIQLALFYLSQEVPEKAITNLEQAQKVMEKNIPKTNTNWALLFETFGKAHESLGDLRKGLEYTQKSYDINFSIYTDIHPNLIASKANLGRIHIKLKEFEKGKELYLDALQMMDGYYAEDDYLLAAHRANIGALMIDLGEPQITQELLEKVLPIFEEKFGQLSGPGNMARLTLGNAYLAQNQFEKADNIYKKVIRDCDAIAGSETLKAMTLNNLGESQTFQGKYEEGQKYTEQAIEIVQNQFGEKHPLKAEIQIYLVDVFMQSGQYGKAQTHLQQCQSIFEQSVPEGGIEFKRVEAWRAVLNKRIGNTASNWQDIMRDLEAQLGPKSPEIEKLRKRWGFNET